MNTTSAMSAGKKLGTVTAAEVGLEKLVAEMSQAMEAAAENSKIRKYQPEIPLRNLRIESMLEFLERRRSLKLHPELTDEIEIAKILVKTRHAKIKIVVTIDKDTDEKQKIPTLIKI